MPDPRKELEFLQMSKYKEMKTEHLINEMVSLCLEIPPELAQEIGSRDNAISFLSDILQGDEYWDHTGIMAVRVMAGRRIMLFIFYL